MALWACLPQFEDYQWEQLTRQFETAAIREAFEEITEQLMDETLKIRPSLREAPENSDGDNGN